MIKPLQLHSIDEVIEILESIIQASEKEQDPLGYFAVLYQKVTKKVKEGIENNFFEDGPRMEKLDVVFAERYLQAFYAYKNNMPVSASWKRAFEISKTRKPMVLQHLLLGINAHINLDLGIAAAEISREGNIDDLATDFFRINEILSSMVSEVAESLVCINPFFKLMPKLIRKQDRLLVDLLMRNARKKAWNFANQLFEKSGDELPALLIAKDQKTARLANWIGKPGLAINVAIQVFRMGEKGSVFDRIQLLRA